MLIYNVRSKNKHILVVGDRVLIRPDKGEKKSKAGLYLPPSVIEKQEILSGIIVEVGPGIPIRQLYLDRTVHPPEDSRSIGYPHHLRTASSSSSSSKDLVSVVRNIITPINLRISIGTKAMVLV